METLASILHKILRSSPVLIFDLKVVKSRCSQDHQHCVQVRRILLLYLNLGNSQIYMRRRNQDEDSFSLCKYDLAFSKKIVDL